MRMRWVRYLCVAIGLAAMSSACSIDDRPLRSAAGSPAPPSLLAEPGVAGASNGAASGGSGSEGTDAAGSFMANAAIDGCSRGTHSCGGACARNDDPATCGEVSCEPCAVPLGGVATCDGVTCGGQCPDGLELCGGACVVVGTGCVGSCPPGSHDCDGTCLSDSSPASCGLRCVACPVPDGSEPVCGNGVCTFTCLPGFRDCNGRCLEPTSIDGCGPSCAVCPLLGGATTTCDGSSCSVECELPDFFPNRTGCVAGATQVSISRGHGCALLFDGTLRCWGANFTGQLGIGVARSFYQQPVVPNIDGVLAVGVGRDFSCALRADGSVWCWGANGSGQLGRGNQTEAEPDPAPVVDIDDALALSVGEIHSCVTRPSGLFCWGDNFVGELGIDASEPTQSRPVRVDIEPVSDVSAGGRSTCALLSGSGAVRCWGQSFVTELPPEAGDRVRAVVVQGAAGCVVLQSNTARCWGRDGSSAIIPLPGGDAVGSLALGEGVACMVSSQGLASCSGNNDQGQLGRGTTSVVEAQSAPVSGLDDALQLSVADNHVCALRTDGSVWCWGSNLGGLLGTYRVDASTVPIPVEPW